MRFRFRFGLRWILFLPIFVCIFLGFERRRAHHQEQLAEQLLAINGTFERTHRPFLPVKFWDMMPDEYGKTITEVTFGGMAALSHQRPWSLDVKIVSKRSLSRVAALPAMRKAKSFRLVGSSVDDEFVSFIAALPNCDLIEVHGTAVTDKRYYPPPARFSVNGRQTLELNHSDSLRLTDDLQIFALAYEEDPQAITELLNLSTSPPKHRQLYKLRRYKIIVATLSEIESPEAIAAVRNALSDSDSKVRRSAVDVLAKLHDCVGLVDALHDKDPEIRHAAMQGVTSLRPDEIHNGAELADAIFERVEDSEPGIQWAAVNWLPSTVDPRRYESLAKALKDDNSTVRAAAARGLGTLADKRAIPDLEKALEDSDSFVKKHAKTSLKLLYDLQ